MLVRVYNATTAEAEITHLNSVDPANLPPAALEAIKVRLTELADIKAALEANSAIVLNIARCQPASPRVPPPLPCPLEDLQVPPPMGTQIELDLAGVFMDIPESSQARMATEWGSARLITTDGKKVFAEGALNAYDDLFHTAWFHFDVKNASLVKKPLILKVSTTIVTQQQPESVVIEIPVPANMFLADNFY